jgi:hypothetical protein
MTRNHLNVREHRTARSREVSKQTRMKAGEPDLRSRTLPIHPLESAISTAPEVYTLLKC